MGIAGETVSGKVLEFRRQMPDQFVPTVPLVDLATPKLVEASQERERDAYWQVMYEQTMDRIRRDLEFALNTQEPGSISHEAVKSELFVEKGCFWFPYLAPEKRRELEAVPVALTTRERTEGLTLPEKKKQRLDRKAYLFNRERKINWQRGVDKSIWERLNNRFFLESKGIVPGDIDEELSKGFLETFKKQDHSNDDIEEMFNFLLGVGWNQTLVDIFDNRSRLVEETREILSQRMFGKHYDELKGEGDKINAIKHALGWGDTEGKIMFGDTRELMKAVRIAQEAEIVGDRQQKSRGLINECLMAKPETTKLDTLNGFTPEQQGQLNRRAQALFGDDFLNLTNEEQLMTAAGPGTILSLEEIMDFLSDYEVPNPYDDTKASLIRPESVDLEYAYWTRLGWVSMIGPWRLADRINKIIFSYSARDDQRVLQRQQIESAGMSGFGKYTYFDWDYYEAFHGAGGEGKRKALLENTTDQFEWKEGFWKEYQEQQQPAYQKYLQESKKENEARAKRGEELKRIADFEEFCTGTLVIGDYKHLAKEWFLGGWRMVAEGVYLRVRGDMVEEAARKGVPAKNIEEALEQDVLGQKISHTGKEVLEKRFEKAKTPILKDIWEILTLGGLKVKRGQRGMRFTSAWKDLIYDKVGMAVFIKDLPWKMTFAETINTVYVGLKAIQTLWAAQQVNFLAGLKIGPYVFSGISVAPFFAALGWAALWGTVWSITNILQDKLYFRSPGGSEKWKKIEEEMNKGFMALAERPVREMAKQGWDPDKASVETHVPIKII